jgi:hypothetical protein
MIDHPTGTLCRCGHLLECCADCNRWLVEHSKYIEHDWQTRLAKWGAQKPGQVWSRTPAGEAADFAEDFYRAYFLLWRNK